MTYFRSFLLVVAILFFFLVAAPLQAVLARQRSASADRIPLFFCRSLLRLLRMSIAVEGSRVARGPCLLVVNHVSWIDILVLGSITPFCFLAKHEVASWPILSAFAKVQGTVFVDRRRRRGILPANRQMAERMREGRTVLLFPEGTTFAGAVPGLFRSSHYAAARDLLRAQPEQESVSVQPVALAYDSNLAAWIGDEALLPHLWRVLKGAPIRCRVSFAEPIAYRRDTDRKVVARLSREAIVRLLPSVVIQTPGDSRPATGKMLISSGVSPD